MHPVETYLRELLDIHRSGEAVKETSYYGPLSNLFNEIGKTLKPKVSCIINIKNRGAGIPDGGLFTAEQLQKVTDTEPHKGLVPARGVIEIKGTSEDVQRTARSEQVLRYLQRYGQVLITNYRDFILLSQSSANKPLILETYHLTQSETDFWNAAANPRQIVAEQGERLIEYLKRVMLHAAPLANPEDVAWFLASYARDAKARIEHSNLAALTIIRADLEKALGITFKGTKGEHFFRSTLVQTLFYGVFSAWVLWCKQQDNARPARFDWRLANWFLHVPMIKALFEQVVTPSKLGPLGLVEVLNWAGEALNRVDQKAFFAKFEETYAVQYFYEPFLQAFDPELRKELGIWYTPPEIVQYMVARVDTTLREELDIEDGLADPRVYVLDPCCGTGAYLVEVLKRIATTLQEKGEDALGSHDIKAAAEQRIFGFELLPAPFVIAHLQLGLLLQNLGAPLSDEKNERVGVYLTNSLTNWDLPHSTQEKVVQLQLAIPELQEERDAAEHIKQQIPILVVLGNPPYNAFAGVSPDEEHGLVDPYKAGLISTWNIKKFNLDDLYVRFFRLAEHRIAEKTGQGIICYISNFSYLSDPSFVVMRQHFLAEFDALWFDCMNGDSRETGKQTPAGKPDPSVFSTEYNREGIRLGTAVGLMVRKSERSKTPIVHFRQFWGTTKRQALLNSLTTNNFDTQYEQVTPNTNNRFSFRPSKIETHYLEWPRLIDFSSRSPFAGIAEDRRKALIGVDRSTIQDRMKMYFDPSVDWETLANLQTCLTTNVPRFDAKKARKLLQQAEKYNEKRLVRFAMRPFDVQWCYYSPVRPLWREPRPEYWAAYDIGSPALVTRFKTASSYEGSPIMFTRNLCDYHMMPPNSSIFPVMLRPSLQKHGGKGTKQTTLIHESMHQPQANLSPTALAYLATLAMTVDSDANTAALIWMHALAIGYAPTYLTENADGIKQDWPRIPLPNSEEMLQASADLGHRVAMLLDTESPISGVTTGKIRLELRTLAVISRVGGGTLNPDAGDLALTAGWGHGGNTITMPGKGKALIRDYTTQEWTAIVEGASVLSLTPDQVKEHLGATTRDIYLNNTAYWRNIPSRVWEYTIGGYQVLKKWLSYREFPLLGRALAPDEVREVTSIARRIAALLLLEPMLNDNYHSIKLTPYRWTFSDTR
ncbi:MAG: type ISP restriction/modification enzyme [Ktedonobacteraceae bacterium]